MKTFISKDGELRIYASHDAGAEVRNPGTPNRPYCKMLFVNGDYTGPIGRNRPEETLVLDRMKFDSNSHFVQGSDSAIADPLSMSFTFRAFDRLAGREIINWLASHKPTTSETLLSTLKGYSGLYDYAGTYWKTNDFTDTSKVCFDVEVKYTPDAGGGPLCIKLHEVLFNQGDQTLNEGEDAVNISLTGNCYGSIDFGSLDFTTGSLCN